MIRSECDGMSRCRMARFQHAFGERGMGVNDPGKFLVGTLEVQERHCLTDQVGGAGADDVDAKDLIILLLANDLHEPRYQ